MRTHSPAEETIVGKIDDKGRIANTGYAFSRRHIVGGLAVSEHTEYIKKDDDLVDALTGDVFHPTKSGKGYFNAKTGLFIKPYATERTG